MHKIIQKVDHSIALKNKAQDETDELKLREWAMEPSFES